MTNAATHAGTSRMRMYMDLVSVNSTIIWYTAIFYVFNTKNETDMILIGLITLLGIMLIMILSITSNDEFATVVGLIAVIVILFLGVSMMIEIEYTDNTIPAIEVYRGNTELQISYIDSIPQDSIVVLKKRN